MSVSTLTSKGQITIPQDVRETLQVDSGDKLSWDIQEDGSVVVRKARRRTVAQLAGLLGKPKRAATVEEMDAAIGRRMKEKLRARR